jgi:hypothetical protein
MQMILRETNIEAQMRLLHKIHIVGTGRFHPGIDFRPFGDINLRDGLQGRKTGGNLERLLFVVREEWDYPPYVVLDSYW